MMLRKIQCMCIFFCSPHIFHHTHTHTIIYIPIHILHIYSKYIDIHIMYCIDINSSLNCHQFIHLLDLHKLVDTFQNECYICCSTVTAIATGPYTHTHTLLLLPLLLLMFFAAQSIFPIWFFGKEKFHHKSLCD